jgi:hypothetical protein
MDESATRLLVAARAEVRGGANRQAVVQFLRDQGATALQATKVVMALYSIPLGEAQAVISLDPEWRASLGQSDETMQEILRRLARGE